jgi:hypothetical protein
LQPEAVEQPLQHIEGRVAFAGFEIAERVNRNAGQGREVFLKDAEASTTLPQPSADNDGQVLQIRFHLSEK